VRTNRFSQSADVAVRDLALRRFDRFSIFGYWDFLGVVVVAGRFNFQKYFKLCMIFHKIILLFRIGAKKGILGKECLIFRKV
jgi:hypothetical protein